MPYTKQVGFDEPENSTTIWRYVDLAKFLDLIVNQRLPFVRADKMADRFEGTLPPGALTAFKEAIRPIWSSQRFEKLAQDTFSRDFATEYALRSKTSNYFSCWHMNEYESGAMWPIYADRGLALQSTIAGLKDAVRNESTHSIRIGRVKYIDVDDPELFRDPSAFGGLFKRRLYDFEREVRAVIYGDLRRVPENPPAVLYATVELPALVQRVWVGPGQSGWVTELIVSLLSQFDLADVEVVRSRMDEDPLAAKG